MGWVAAAKVWKYDVPHDGDAESARRAVAVEQHWEEGAYLLLTSQTAGTHAGSEMATLQVRTSCEHACLCVCVVWLCCVCVCLCSCVHS